MRGLFIRVMARRMRSGFAFACAFALLCFAKLLSLRGVSLRLDAYLTEHLECCNSWK